MSYGIESDRSTESARPNMSAAQIAGDEHLTAGEAAVECLKAYVREHPEIAALWIFGAGFVLGWKLRPW